VDGSTQQVVALSPNPVLFSVFNRPVSKPFEVFDKWVVT
jgi:hypothetical protein